MRIGSMEGGWTMRLDTQARLLPSLERRALVGVALAAGLAGCSHWVDGRRWHVSRDELVMHVQRQFPREHRVLDIVDVVLRTPRLNLLPQTNRLATELDIGASERVMGRSVQGVIGFEHGLRFEPSDLSVRLAQVRVTRLDLSGPRSAAPSAAADTLWQGLGATLAQRVLEDLSVFKLSGQRAEAVRAMGVRDLAMTVTAAGLDLHFASPPVREARPAAR